MPVLTDTFRLSVSRHAMASVYTSYTARGFMQTEHAHTYREALLCNAGRRL